MIIINRLVTYLDFNLGFLFVKNIKIWLWIQKNILFFLPFDMKSLGHRSHWKFRSALMPLLWLRWWNSRLPFSGNDLPHSSHAYGRSPVWHRLKRIRSNDWIIDRIKPKWIGYNPYIYVCLLLHLTLTSCDWWDAPCAWTACCTRCTRADCRPSGVASGWSDVPCA